ncbi:helicase HerA-like domain-containing protein [Thermaurantiacus tibetensis]|uniref:helicase HerA-like domain-containing protein n=1 Tax=Thermaurantiacus tibetensis TaxID=2759035 RepID=UPI00188E30E0|nr:helicase HerA-like domain-containing protein [Thermaurantiacus tibetensis]
MTDGIFIGRGEEHPQHLLLARANRHGLVAGATGTGKTVTLQVLAEGFSRAGVPVFFPDMKGDVAGMALPGSPQAKTHEAFTKRAAELGLASYAYADNPVVLWDLFGQQGHPVRTTVSEMGPLLLARLMGLNDTQEGVLNVAFRYADEQGLLVLDLKDLQQLLAHCADNAAELAARYGNVTRPTVGAIQRQLLTLEAQGGANFFGEPALDIADMMAVEPDGRGRINILAADRLMQAPRLYSTFLLWLLSELFEELPEVGDPEKPRLVFFFDEAHLLFDEAPKALLERVEQVVRLIRSKGVGVYFCTQNPVDIPDSVAGQLGNRIQHALRAFTPKDQKAVRAAAETFRPNPKVDVRQAITELRVGEALVSVLDAKGAPTPVERTLVAPPVGRVGPLTEAERKVLLASSPVAGRYEEVVDRESAYEILLARAEARNAEAEAAKAAKEAERAARERARAEAAAARAHRQSPRGRAEAELARVATSVGRSMANQVGRSLVRGLLGGLFGGRR